MLEKDLIREAVFESMNVIPEDIFKESMLAVADASSGVLANTLGPYARTSIIDDGTYKYPTKDGMNVLRRLRFSDPFYQSLLSFIHQISRKLVSTVGDGTTTALVAACKFINLYETLSGRDYSRVRSLRQAELIDILKEISDNVERIITSEEYGLIRKVKTDNTAVYDDIKNIALVSSNGNEEVANAIAYLYEQTNNPNIYVTIDAVTSLVAEVQKGYKFDGHLLNQKIYANTDGGTFEANESILVCMLDHNVTYAYHGKLLNMLIQYANKLGKQILIIAPNFDDTFLTLIGTQLNNLREQGQIPSIMLMQGATSLSLHKKYYQDLAKVAKTEVMNKEHIRIIYTLTEPTEENRDEINQILSTYLRTDENGNPVPISADDIIKEHVGILNDVKIDTKQMICGIDTKSDTYKLHVNEVSKEFEELKEKDSKSSTSSKDYMQEYLRYSRLLGNLGIIKVGGESDIEKMCLKDSVDDAVLACKSAFENGYVRGFNITTLTALNILREEILNNKTKICADESTTIGLTLINIFEMVFNAVNGLIVQNKFHNGIDDAIQMATAISNTCIDNNMVYDLVAEGYYDWDTSEIPPIINPANTDIEIFKAIVSFLSLLITSNQMITLNKFMGLKKTKADELKESANNKAYEAETIVNTILPALKEVASSISLNQTTVYQKENRQKEN